MQGRWGQGERQLLKEFVVVQSFCQQQQRKNCHVPAVISRVQRECCHHLLEEAPHWHKSSWAGTERLPRVLPSQGGP